MIKVEAESRGYLAQRAVGSGFQSVLFADCRSVEDAQECIRSVRPDTPEDRGTFGSVARRFTYMGYGGKRLCPDAARHRRRSHDRKERRRRTAGRDSRAPWAGYDSMGRFRLLHERRTPRRPRRARGGKGAGAGLQLRHRGGESLPAQKSAPPATQSDGSTSACAISASAPILPSCAAGGPATETKCARL